ncbi:MAG TPA: PadR family transcriptional regulator [Vicinamibacteria bacterium]|jgi:PadR family transcriptional regulator PadR
MTLEAWQEQLRRGALEFAILLALAREPRYGLELIRHLEAETDLVLLEGTVYPILARLTRDGLLSAEWNAEEASHPRKYYHLSERGRRRLQEMTGHWRAFSGGIERLIAGGSRKR